MIRRAIRKRMKERGMPQTLLGREMGVPASNLNAFVWGARPMPYHRVTAILERLGLGVVDTLTGRKLEEFSALPRLLRGRIIEKRMRLKDAALACGASPATLAAYLNGYRGMKLERIESLMSALDLEVGTGLEQKGGLG